MRLLDVRSGGPACVWLTSPSFSFPSTRSRIHSVAGSWIWGTFMRLLDVRFVSLCLRAIWCLLNRLSWASYWFFLLLIWENLLLYARLLDVHRCSSLPPHKLTFASPPGWVSIDPASTYESGKLACACLTSTTLPLSPVPGLGEPACAYLTSAIVSLSSVLPGIRSVTCQLGLSPILSGLDNLSAPT